MRLSLALIGLGLCATGLAASCSSYSIDQCASDCACQRVACCCGTGCDKSGSTVRYNACVPANSPYEQWTGCPATSSCSSSSGGSGLVRTITPCVVPTPAPTSTQNSSSPEIPFGTTFPMIGTQALSKQTWQSNVYMGTTTKFNQGAYFGYTDSYSVPSWNYNSNNNGGGSNGGYDGGYNYGQPSPAPTPEDATGRPCYGYSQPCPTGYYCKLNTGYNVQQKGTCARESTDTWNGGAGKFTDSQYYTSLAHPPLVNEPGHNGVAGYGGYGNSYYGSGSIVNFPGSAGSESCAPLPTGAPVCGYKSFTGTCFCDSTCSNKGDCCADYAQYCGVLSNQYTGYTGPSATSNQNTPAYTPPATTPSNCDAVGQCAGLCGSSTPATGVNGKPCYCDSQCALSGDCCCSQSQCSFSG